jgi:hypothetical protein
VVTFAFVFPQKPFEEQWIFWVTTSGFFSGEVLQKINLKNVISTNTNDFSCGKWSKLAKFREEKKTSNSQISTISSSR